MSERGRTEDDIEKMNQISMIKKRRTRNKSDRKDVLSWHVMNQLPLLPNSLFRRRPVFHGAPDSDKGAFIYPYSRKFSFFSSFVSPVMLENFRPSILEKLASPKTMGHKD